MEDNRDWRSDTSPHTRPYAPFFDMSVLKKSTQCLRLVGAAKPDGRVLKLTPQSLAFGANVTDPLVQPPDLDDLVLPARICACVYACCSSVAGLLSLPIGAALQTPMRLTCAMRF